MIVLDTNQWTLFRIGDIFDIYGGFFNKKPEHSDGLFEPQIPFLGSTENDNGETERYYINDIRKWDKVGNPDDSLAGKIFKAGSIAVTVNGSVCNAFFQPEDYTCSHDITSLRPKDGHELTVEEGLFLCTVIRMEKYRWSYGRKPHDLKKFANMTIKLPAITEIKGQVTPDWDWMKNFMSQYYYGPLQSQNQSSERPLPTDTWTEFRLGDLFDVKKGKRLTSEDQTEGDNLYIGAIDSNNGVAAHIGQMPIHEGNTISLSYNGSIGEAFYQPEPFWATDDVNVLYLKPKYGFKMNKFVGLFFCTILRQEKYRYAYGRKWTLGNMKNTVIKLPSIADAEGRITPDWLWMEKYIKSLAYSDLLEDQ